MNKREWRTHFRALHKGREERNRQSELVCKHIMDWAEYKHAGVIGGYMPLPHETDVLPLLKDALAQGKTLALPLCGQAPHMTLRLVSSLDELVPGAYGILEPKETAPIIPVEVIDLLLVPLEGIDRKGNRLGKGGGYYDCLLAGCDAKSVGCALTWQWTEELPSQSWDRRLYACADKDGIHLFSKE